MYFPGSKDWDFKYHPESSIQNPESSILESITKVSIIEDSRAFQQTLIDLLRESGQFSLGHVCSSAEEAIPLIGELSGIVIIDIKLPKMNGAQLVWHITQGNKNAQCLICSMYDDDEFIFTALKNGALGYLLKDSSREQIVAALIGLEQGGSPMSPYIARRVIASFQAEAKTDPLPQLTEREKEILNQVSKGLTYKEISDEVKISYETVKQHLKNIYHKLHVQNKVEALNKMNRRG